MKCSVYSEKRGIFNAFLLKSFIVEGGGGGFAPLNHLPGLCPGRDGGLRRPLTLRLYGLALQYRVSYVPWD